MKAVSLSGQHGRAGGVQAALGKGRQGSSMSSPARCCSLPKTSMSSAPCRAHTGPMHSLLDGEGQTPVLGCSEAQPTLAGTQTQH